MGIGASPLEQNLTTTERSDPIMSIHNDCYTNVTLSVKTSWLGPLYQLLADLSNNREVTNTHVDKSGEPRTSYMKLGKLPSLVARHCECGKCHGKLGGTSRSPWRTTYVGFYRASDGREYTPCKALLDAVRQGAPRTLVGFIYAPEDRAVDNWRERVDRTKASYTLDKLESERQLRVAKLNSVVVDTSVKMGELKTSNPKADLPKLVKVAPLKDAATTSKAITIDSAKPPKDDQGAKPKVPIVNSRYCTTPSCRSVGLVNCLDGLKCIRHAPQPIPDDDTYFGRNIPDRPEPIPVSKDEGSWIPWRKSKSWNDYKPGN